MKERSVTLLDVCQATQKDLERYFLRPGRCFGDLRRVQLMMGQMAKRTLQMQRAMTRAGIGLASALSDAFIQAYLDHAKRDERYPEDGEPRFCGGTLEKTRLSWCEECDKSHRMEKNTHARNAKKRRSRSFRKSLRVRTSLSA